MTLIPTVFSSTHDSQFHDGQKFTSAVAGLVIGKRHLSTHAGRHCHGVFIDTVKNPGCRLRFSNRAGNFDQVAVSYPELDGGIGVKFDPGIPDHLGNGMRYFQQPRSVAAPGIGIMQIRVNGQQVEAVGFFLRNRKLNRIDLTVQEQRLTGLKFS